MTHTPTLRPQWKKLTAISAASLMALSMAGTAAAEDFKIGIVSFLSGQAADSFGVPAVNGAKTLLEAFNGGKAPAPYNKKGFGGMNIVPVYVDENGGATKQVQELRNLYDREGVDMAHHVFSKKRATNTYFVPRRMARWITSLQRAI